MNAIIFKAALTRFLLIFALVTPTAAAAEAVLIPQGAVWQHLNTDAAPPADWNTLEFTAESCPSGPAQLGYGDGDEATRTEGAEMFPRPVTAYFRHRFAVSDGATFDNLLIRLVRDDGAVVYLNGVEVARNNMPDGSITHETLASSTIGADAENVAVPIEISADALRAGLNVIAVEVHQVNVSSSDLSFDLSLVARTVTTPERPTVSVVARVGETTEPTVTSRVAPGVFVFTRTGDLSRPLPVYVRYEGTATMAADYQELPRTLTFPEGRAAVEVPVYALQDGLNEPTETVVAIVQEPPTRPDAVPYNIDPARGSARIEIHNASNPQEATVVSIHAARAQTSEPIPNALIAPGLFTVRRSGAIEQPLRVQLHYAGTATAGVDYSALPSSIEFAAGESAHSLNVIPHEDNLVEGAETVVAEIALSPEAPGYQIDPAANRAVVSIADADGDEEDATLEIVEPTNGQVFTDSDAIRIRAVGVDPRGYISRVEFYAGVGLVGVSEITHIVAPEPGTPAHHEFIWRNVPNGEHVLTARTVTASGDGVRSAPVTITVRDENPSVPVVSIAFVEFPVMPPLPSGDYIPGALEVRRTGPTTEPLQVFYRVSEVGVPERPIATPGVDYERLSNYIVIPAGRTSAHITARAIDDEIPELREYIHVQLTGVPPNVDPMHNALYQVDPARGEASLYVVDDDGPVSPTVRIARPLNGTVFTLGQWIEIRAEIGAVANFQRLEILADGQVLETFTAHHAGYFHVWHNATVGTHVLSAKLYAGGAVVESARVQVLVREAAESAFVHRELPDGYRPGVPFVVELRATPPEGARAYAVEDRPPVGWTVSAISHDGVFDSVSGKVKFGPFTDGDDRTLTYTLRPAENAEGHREFDGTGSVNGQAYVIGGERVIRPGPTVHPADTNSDFALVINEVTAYAAAWKAGETWATGPNPIPLSYVTRAGFIWKRGEAYQFNPNIMTPPFYWVPTAGQLVIAQEGGVAAEASRIGEAHLRPGAASTIQLSIAAASGTVAQAIEERVPAGWTVSGISHEGSFDAATSTIRWGTFYDGEARTLSYTITPPADVAVVGRFYGRFSMDGHTMTVGGLQHTASYEERPRLIETALEADGTTLRLRLNGAAGQVGTLQRSGDLVTWEDVGQIFLPEGQAEFTAPLGELPNAYYRLQIR